MINGKHQSLFIEQIFLDGQSTLKHFEGTTSTYICNPRLNSSLVSIIPLSRESISEAQVLLFYYQVGDI